MLRYRHDPLSRRLMITMLLMINVAAIREEYLEKDDLSWVTSFAFLLPCWQFVVCAVKSSNADCLVKALF